MNFIKWSRGDKLFLVSVIISLFYFILSIFININWIHDISCYLGYPLAIYLVVFIALIPGFIYVFMFISLLCEKKEEKNCVKKACDVTVLIPVYNAKSSIMQTLNSIKRQKYNGNIHVIIIDDGSIDGSLELLKSMCFDSRTMLLERCHNGKSFALNEALKCVRTDYVITIDSDTFLHSSAIQSIMNKLLNSNENTVC